MKFVIQPGSDPVARADSTLLSAMGLPGGGVVAIGTTHCLVRPGEVPSPNYLMVGPISLRNAGVAVGASIDVKRVLLSQAQRVLIAPSENPLDPRHLARSLQGVPVTNGDKVSVKTSYGNAEGEATSAVIAIREVVPGGRGLVGSATVVAEVGEHPEAVILQPEGHPGGEAPTTAEALLAGLETELDVMTGWLSLLTAANDLPDAWGLPKVAGVIVEGPTGCGKSELVAAAAATAGATVNEVSVELVFKPDKLLEVLEKAITTTLAPGVIYVDRLDAVVGEEALFRNQVAAILRWFLDSVAKRPRLACVLGVSDRSKLAAGVTDTPLLPRTLTIPPPDAKRRQLLLEAAMARVPAADDIDFAHLAGRSAGFSGADLLASVVHASAMIARGGGEVTTELLGEAIGETTPSLGTSSLGEVPSYGFERVANLTEVKQRLTESVIWQMTEPDRFKRLGIEPPRGLLLYGPPGTGKTFVIRALANEAGAAFFTVKGAELLDKFVGESERAVREVFARARAVAPSILFFDEMDALAPVRGNSTNSVTDSVVAALLTEMDGVSERGDVFVIGATNRRDLIDPALLRPGRLEVHLKLGLPAPEARQAYFGISDVPLADGIDMDEVIAATEGLSFADLSGMLREAALQALRRDATAMEVTIEDLMPAIDRYQNR